MTVLLTIFQRFPTIFQNCSEGRTNIHEHFLKISKDFQRLPKTDEEDPKKFWSFTNQFKHILKDKLDISEIIDILKCT